jgi:N-acyl-D-amino-acid deacylase
MPFDVTITDTDIIDGTGKRSFRGSIAISKGRIAAVGAVSGPTAATIDGKGLVSCPGFVDAHSHADLSILQFPGAENLLRQGITTFVGGNCGIALAPIRDRSYFDATMRAWNLDIRPAWKTYGGFLDAVEAAGTAVNMVPLAGHNALRGAVLGTQYMRTATRRERSEMASLLTEAMDSGCFGLSGGFDAATPGHYAAFEEVVELVELVRRRQGIFTPHTRHHQNQWPASTRRENAYGIYHGPRGEIITGRYHGLLEAVEIARAAGGARLHIAHLTPAYIVPQPHPAALDEALARATLEAIIDAPAAEGMDVSFNVVSSPHSIGAELPVIDSFFSALLPLPQWLRSMDREGFVRKLKTRGFRSRVRGLADSGKLKFGMIHPVTDPYWSECYRIQRCRNPQYEGKTIWELARERERRHTTKAVYHDAIEVLCDILVDDPGATWALVVDKREYGTMQHLLRHPLGMPITDVHAMPAAPSGSGGIFNYGISPTAFGAFPFFLDAAVHMWRILSLEEAIARVTSVPARRVFGLADRGVLEPGACADMVIFDPRALKAADDFLDPYRAPAGIRHVLVNGVVACENGRCTGTRSGAVIRRA